MTTTLLYRPFATMIDALELDASLTETHEAEVDVTQFPVEVGVAVSDHARPKPRKVQIEGLVSNTPINQGATSYGMQGQVPFVKNAYATLIDLADNPRLVTVVTELESYSNMVMDSLKIPRDAKIGDVLKFEAHFIYVRQVTNQATVVAVKPKTAGGKPKVAQGTKSTYTPPSPKGSELIKERVGQMTQTTTSGGVR